jgi:hypothetical protein
MRKQRFAKAVHFRAYTDEAAGNRRGGILFYFWWDNLTGLASSRRGMRGIAV